MSADVAAPAGLGTGHALALFRQMQLIRRFEEQTQSLFQSGEVHGTTHLYVGQEAVATGVCDVLGDDDLVAGTYRGHGHAIAVGVPPDGILAELMGRETGVCGGRAGSMNIVDLPHRLIGCFGIIGGSMSAAVGAAMSLRRKGGVAVAFFGDGATNHGYFHECLNFARVNELPVVFVCENNLYGEFTPWEAVTAGQIADRPRTLDIPTRTIDGNDVFVVRETAAEAVEHARSGTGPFFVEALTYRFVGHSRSDPGAYRKPGELDRWRRRDPLLLAAQRLAGEFAVDDGALDAIRAAVDDQVAAMTEACRAAPFPDPAKPVSEFKD